MIRKRKATWQKSMMVFALLSSVSFASPGVYELEAISSNGFQVDLTTLESWTHAPRLPAEPPLEYSPLSVSLASIYAGSAYALSRFVVVVGNIGAPCEGDDCTVQEGFEISGNYHVGYGEPLNLRTRKVADGRYRIEFDASRVEPDDFDNPYKPITFVLDVRLTPDGVERTARLTVVARPSVASAGARTSSNRGCVPVSQPTTRADGSPGRPRVECAR